MRDPFLDPKGQAQDQALLEPTMKTELHDPIGEKDRPARMRNHRIAVFEICNAIVSRR